MKTHSLETKSLLRATVSSAEPIDTTCTSVRLKTHTILTAKKKLSSASDAALTSSDVSKVGQAIDGCLQIDVLSDTVFRVRYAEGETVPENQTPMLAGLPAPATRCDICPVDGGIEITTTRCVLRIQLSPYRLEIRNLEGHPLCGVGGPEKNLFGNWDNYNTGLCRQLGENTSLAVENFDLIHNEAIYGFGEKFIKLNKVGQTIDLMMQDALGVITPRSYKNVPFFVSTRGYGVFFNHHTLMTYWVGSMSATDIQVALEEDFLDYFIFIGSIKEVLSSYTDLTGKGALPPKWSFGFWQSKYTYYSAAETLEIAHKMRQEKIPCDVIHLDTGWFEKEWFCDLEFSRTRFPDPEAYFTEMKRLGFKISLWQMPYVMEGSQLFDDLRAVDGFIKNPDGSLYDLGWNFVPGFSGIVAVIDFTNPPAVCVYQEALRKLFRLGASVVKTDFGEEAPINGIYHDGTPGNHMRNLYPLLYNKAVFEVTQQETPPALVWARSAWAGSQRYPLHWGGDNTGNYFNMVPQLEGGLSFGLSGFQFWSQDIGGFTQGAANDLFIRWYQIGLFLSHSRIHGGGDREIYKLDPEVRRICTDYLNLRYRLLPYIYGTAMDCVARSLPMTRALVVEYQDDPTVYDIGDEYLFGSNLLVAPIFDPSGKRKVYLPAGIWTSWWTRQRIAGGRWVDIEASLEIMPIYIREGGIIPMQPVMNYVDEFKVEEVELWVSLFENEGSSHFDVPVNNQVVPVDYIAKNKTHTITIGPSEVSFQIKILDNEQDNLNGQT